MGGKGEDGLQNPGAPANKYCVWLRGYLKIIYIYPSWAKGVVGGGEGGGCTYLYLRVERGLGLLLHPS